MAGGSQRDSLFGYGKWIDNSENLVYIECHVNDIPKQIITYGGYPSLPQSLNNVTQTLPTNNNHDFFYDFSQDDIWINDINKQGFRLKGEFKQKDIVASNIGDPSDNAYNIKYKYTRYKSTSNTFKTTISVLPNLENIYIDDLSKNPIITDISYSVIISSIGKTMTIPSTKAMKIKVERKYENINSKYKIIPGDRVAAQVDGITKVEFEANNILERQFKLNTADISSNGVYDYSFNITSYYTDAISVGSDSSTTLVTNEKAISLFATNIDSNNIIVKHFFDKNNFTYVGDNSIKTKLQFESSSNIYQISDISQFSNASNIVPVKINKNTADSLKPLNHTLLFLDGKFTTNAKVLYPNVASDENFEWYRQPPFTTATSTPFLYSTGEKSYDLLGNEDTNNGYKWIGFNFKATDISIEGLDNYIDLEVKLKNKYFDNNNVLHEESFFNSNILNYLFDEDNMNVIGFIKVGEKVGNLSTSFFGSSPWFGFNTSPTLQAILNDEPPPAIYNTGYGTLYSNGKGPVMGFGPNNTTHAHRDSIYIFIGLKNSVAL